MPETTILKNEEKVTFRLRGLYQSHGYMQYRMSKFEEYDLYVRNKSFLISDNIITFTDTNGKLMALKPDVTLSIVKNTKEMKNGVRKVYYNENVYRPARGSRTFKEITQVGLECIGDVDGYCISEALSLAAESLAEISEEYVLDVSHLGMLSYVLDRIPCGTETKEKFIACIGEKNTHDLRAGAKAAGITEEQLAPLDALLSCGQNAGDAEKLGGLFADPVWKTMTAEFSGILSSVPGNRVRVDFSVIHDMSYYNGIVFAGFVRGIPNSVLSGGQYDRLMEKMGRKEHAVGFAVYLDQLDFLNERTSENDADILLLYKEGMPYTKIRMATEEYITSGKTVLVSKNVPEKMTFGEIVRL